MSSSFCYNCDTRNPDNASFCVTCGKPLPTGAPQPTAVAAQPAPVPVRPSGTAYPQSYAPPSHPYPQGYAAPALAGANGPIIQNIYVNQGLPSVVVQQQSISILVRAVWFLFAGLWLGQIWLLFAWLFNLTLIGLPLGLWMLNKMPQVMTLRPNQQQLYLQMNGALLQGRPAGASFVVRAVYFVLVGWWVSFLWLQLAWLFSASLIGLPLSFLMFERTAAVATLGD